MMRWIPFVALAGCVALPEASTADSQSIAGAWRQGELTLSISSFSTFAVESGCTATGGVLRPLGGSRYRIERYETGFATERCGPWRSGPAIAPFDGAEVDLVRQGNRLVASGAGRRVALRWVSPAAV